MRRPDALTGERARRWSGDGSELYFLDMRLAMSNIALMAVPMRADGHAGLSPGAPVKLFQFASFTTVPENNNWVYAPRPDGQRFLVAVQAESGAPTIHLITNWLKADLGLDPTKSSAPSARAGWARCFCADPWSNRGVEGEGGPTASWTTTPP